MMGSKINDDEVGDPVRGLLFGLVVVMVVLLQHTCRPYCCGRLMEELAWMERSYRNVAFGKSDVNTCRNSIQKVRRRTYLAKGLKHLRSRDSIFFDASI